MLDAVQGDSVLGMPPPVPAITVALVNTLYIKG